MVIKPKIRGFICTNAHPLGCAAVVAEREDVVDRLLSIPSLCINNIMGLYENCGQKNNACC